MHSPAWNTYAMAILGTLLVAFGLSVLGDMLFESPELDEPGYVIATAEEDSGSDAAAEPAGPEPLPVRLANADTDAGQRTAKQCVACHNFQKGEGNKIGPLLWNVVGRPVASEEGFSYTDAMQEFAKTEGEWTFEHLDNYLTDPKGVVPGTAMNFAGIKDDQDRANVIAYLHTLSDDPLPLPEPEAAPAEGGDEAAASEGEAGGAQAEATPEETPAPATATGGGTAAPEGEVTEETAQSATEQGASDVPGGDAGQEQAQGEQAQGEQSGQQAAPQPENAQQAPDQAQPASPATPGPSTAQGLASGTTDAQQPPTGNQPAAATAEGAQTAKGAGEQAAETSRHQESRDLDENAAQQQGQAQQQAQNQQPAEGQQQAQAPAGNQEPPSPTVAMIADASPEAGEKVAAQCRACHTFDKGGANRIGPNLWEIVNRQAATHEGFKYTDAMKKHAQEIGTWTYNHLDTYLADPRGVVPGTKMIFAGVKKDEDRAALLAYLRTLSDNPAPLPGQ
ncbi:c-type cytochrome [Afifella sp. JA880]|uniref:c-type cytochrome n=1 Tax=Afifella sp. JA880 TaxID=2975280 RepID=UPI0021BB9AE5|nr:c-type cytochrome [Afifella sp. JA880]MCT8268958.1 c-type cytochrome [Afifella sp. JA880]